MEVAYQVAHNFAPVDTDCSSAVPVGDVAVARVMRCPNFASFQQPVVRVQLAVAEDSGYCPSEVVEFAGTDVPSAVRQVQSVALREWDLAEAAAVLVAEVPHRTAVTGTVAAAAGKPAAVVAATVVVVELATSEVEVAAGAAERPADKIAAAPSSNEQEVRQRLAKEVLGVLASNLQVMRWKW